MNLQQQRIDFSQPCRHSDLQRQFEKFHNDNPEVYQLFEQYAFKVIRAGFKQYGSATVWERMRWHKDMQTHGDSFKLNNNFKAYYARMFMAKNPEHDGFFETRVLRATS